MKHRWAALIFVLALTALVTRGADAQGGTGRDRGAGMELGQNFPNPFNPETRIPFALGDPDQCDAARLYRVTLRVYNVLSQPVATPLLQGEGAPPDMAGRTLENLSLPCGRYTAYWDGNYMNTSREVASGVYLYVLEVDGRKILRRMIVTK
ncbi:MAG TPA: hypothetical protein VMM18_09480 [Gemmatimonadaceae bacterium]|nr:hypothetical protein [Gemmatimonadaceae bacterium]